MKKIFVNPEVNTHELAPIDAIMASGDIALNNGFKSYATVEVDSKLSEQYNIWKGVNSGWTKE